MSLTKAQLARRAAEKLRIVAPNEILSAEDLATIESEVDAVKAELESTLFDGSVLLWEDYPIDESIAHPFLQVLLPSIAPHYGVAPGPDDMAAVGFRRLSRVLAVGFNRATFEADPPL